MMCDKIKSGVQIVQQLQSEIDVQLIQEFQEDVVFTPNQMIKIANFQQFFFQQWLQFQGDLIVSLLSDIIRDFDSSNPSGQVQGIGQNAGSENLYEWSSAYQNPNEDFNEDKKYIVYKFNDEGFIDKFKIVNQDDPDVLNALRAHNIGDVYNISSNTNSKEDDWEIVTCENKYVDQNISQNSHKNNSLGNETQQNTNSIANQSDDSSSDIQVIQSVNNQQRVLKIHPSIINQLMIIDKLKQITINEIKQQNIQNSYQQQHFRSLNFIFDDIGQHIPNKTHKLYSLQFKADNIDIQDVLDQLSSSYTVNGNIISNQQLEQIQINKYDGNQILECKKLNKQQFISLLMSYLCDYIAILGPPGTGKTYTVSMIINNYLLNQGLYIYKYYDTESQIYLCPKVKSVSNPFELLKNTPQNQIIVTAHSNNAVDQIVHVFNQNNIFNDVFLQFRYGIQKEQTGISVDNWITYFYLQISQSQQLPTSVYQQLREIQRYCKQHQSHAQYGQYFSSFQAFQQRLIKCSAIVYLTTTQFISVYNQINKNPILIIEEAAHMAQYNFGLFASKLPVKVIMLGDILQLPPLVKDQQLDNVSLISKSMFYKTLLTQPQQCIMLNQQHRVPFQISQLYENVYQEISQQFSIVFNKFQNQNVNQDISAIEYYQIDGSFQQEQNFQEAQFIVDSISNNYQNNQDYTLNTITILCMYQKQKSLILKLLRQKRISFNQVYTIDEYQGLENDIIVLSLTSNHPSKYADNINRWLVAVSRCKQKLIIVGNISEFQNQIALNIKDFISQQNEQFQ